MSLLQENSGRTPSNDGFAAMASEVRGEEKWYHINWAAMKEWKSLYVISACASFFLLFLFGVVTIVPTTECVIEDAAERCCDCLTTNSSRIVGQTMPTETGYNSIYYGIVMVVNSLFGFYYVIVGVKTENKYQLSCMLATQVLEVARALTDTWFEHNTDLQSRLLPRQILAYASLLLLIVSAALIPPLYKQFGWSIFRKGGVLKPVRERYKLYQTFRAFNRLDVQSSTLLFIVFGLYLSFIYSGGIWWVFVCIIVCDVLASRYMVRYLKREAPVGFYITVVAKSFVVIWWAIITYEYMACRGRYMNSIEAAEKFWTHDPYPSFKSVKKTYNGVNCLAPNTQHDDRTLELVWLNLAQAVVFRVGSMIYGLRVAARFGGGLKAVFYRESEGAIAAKRAAEESKRPQGGQAIKFVAKKKSRKGKQSSNLDDEELKDTSSFAGSSSSSSNNVSADYQQYQEEDNSTSSSTTLKNNNSNNHQEDDEEEEDAMMAEHGISRKEMYDDLAW